MAGGVHSNLVLAVEKTEGVGMNHPHPPPSSLGLEQTQ